MPLENTCLRGRYTYKYAASGSMITGSGGHYSTRTFRLRRNGKFEATSFFFTSFGAATSGGETSGVISTEKPATTGKYLLEGHTLTLNYDDGRVLTKCVSSFGSRLSQ